VKERIEEALKEVREMLAMHGGSVELIGVTDEGVVKVRLTGGCAGCPAAQMTVVNVVEKTIKSKVPEVKRVEAV
jgi:Fe-S cluster biogenesis protein NfuA